MLTTIWLSGAFSHFLFHSSMVAVALEMRSSYFPRFSQPLLSHKGLLPLILLPRLTHVAIRTYEPRDVAQPIFSICPNLTMLIVFSTRRNEQRSW